jgi:tetratricopeptide (TPR) repeat protein
LARDEFAWARRSFEEALVLDPEHEDGLAGLGETLLWFGQHESALRSFRRVLELGYQDDIDLMLQSGRALFRAGLIEPAKEFFEIGVQQAPDSAEAVACVGYAQHRLGDDDGAIVSLRKALEFDSDHAEARIYLGNILYDRSDYEAALYHLDRTTPGEHWDELGIWRLVELKKQFYQLADEAAELKPWDERLTELAGEPDDIDEMLAEIEGRAAEADEGEARGQLELFGALLTEMADQKSEPESHQIVHDGRQFVGSWDDIVREMRDANDLHAGRTLREFMVAEAERGQTLSGIEIPTSDAESFIRGSASAGLLRIVR